MFLSLPTGDLFSSSFTGSGIRLELKYCWCIGHSAFLGGGVKEYEGFIAYVS
jgi:hypothetical protein